MKKRRFLLPLLLIPALAGCVTMPSGPSVMALPGDDKSFEQFQADDGVCRQWAAQQLGVNPEVGVQQNVVGGATAGTFIGAGIGALLGAAAGDPAAGAAIGAGSGLLMGSAAGANAGQAYGYDAQRRYDIGYQQCMYAKGNQIPGARRSRIYAPRPMSAPLPPPGYGTVPPDYHD